MSKTYLVKWEIGIDAESPVEAAVKALEIHRDPESIATYFTVEETERKTPPIGIDLLSLGDNEEEDRFKEIQDALISYIGRGLKPSYDDLVFVDYDEGLHHEQVHSILQGRADTVWQGLEDAYLDAKESGAVAVLESLLSEAVTTLESKYPEEVYEVADSLPNTSEWQDLLSAIEARDNFGWFDQLLDNTRAPLLRAEADDNPDPIWYGTVEELEEAIKNLLVEQGIPESAAEVSAEEIATNAGEGWRKFYWLFTPRDLKALLDADPEDTIEVNAPALWATNPYAGDGWYDELALPIRVKRENIGTDGGAGGCSADDVFGFINNVFSREVSVVGAPHLSSN